MTDDALPAAGKSVTLEAHEITTGDRRSAYCHPSRDFSDTAAIWSVILHTPVTPAQVALCMIGLKLSRECRNHKRDNLVDIAGYAQTIEMLGEKTPA
jgi:hypothetical protein